MSLPTTDSIPLQQSRISNLLPTELHSMIAKWFVLAETNSTNEFLGKIDNEALHANICLAESQSRGRGRRGNSWIASPYRNIMMSLSWLFPSCLQQMSALSLVAAVAIVKALESFDISAQVKWPNDIYLKGRKLSGLLINLQSYPQGGCQAVLGIGLNVHLLPEDGDKIDQPWIDLYSILPKLSSKQLDRNHLIAEIIKQMLPLLNAFPYNVDAVLAQWRRYALYLNQQVVLSKRDKGDLTYEGMMRGVSSTGALMLETATGDYRFFEDSSLSLRPI